MEIKIAVPATSANLGPGFDTLGVALKLYNYLEIDPDTDTLAFEISGEGSAVLPRGTTNLVYQAVAAVYQEVGQLPPPLKIKQTNYIPPSSGLGSSAAAVVGGLTAANLLLNNPLSTDQLLQLAAKIEGHPDNAAPALIGGLVISGTDADQIIWQQLQPKNPPQVIVVVPDFSLRTAHSRGVLPQKVAFQDAVDNLSRLAFLLHCFASGDYTNLRFACEDSLHQNYRAQLIPGFHAVIAACYQAGGLGAALSGAGPSVIAFAEPSKAETVGAAMQAAFAQEQIASRVFITEIAEQGAGLV